MNPRSRSRWIPFAAALLLLLPRAADSADDRWDRTLWEAHVPGDLRPARAVTPLLVELRRQIEAVLDAGHLAPLRFSGADQVAEGFYLYTEPGRILNTLGAAYPYLSRAQQLRVRAYVDRELEHPEYSPWSPEPTLPPDQGARREPYPMSRPWQWEWARQRAASRPRLSPLYGLWLYSWWSGDRSAATRNWPALRTFYGGLPPDAEVYGTFGAHLAMARLAHDLHDDATLDLAVGRARTAFASGLDLDLMTRRMRVAYRRHFDGFNDRGLAAGNWFFLDLAPETGRYLREHLREPVLRRHRALLEAFPHWWVYRPWYASGWTGHESQGLPPELPGMIYPVERWVAGTGPAELAAFHPQHAAHGTGDCHALESLVLVLHAHGTDTWVDVRNHPHPPPVTVEGRPCPDLNLTPAPGQVPPPPPGAP